MLKKSVQGWLVFSGIVVVIVGYIIWQQVNKPFYPDINSPRPVRGDTNSKVTVEEFSDFECPACKAAQPTVDDVLSTLGDKIKFEYKHFPLVSVHPQAFRAAQASECANDQGKFWEYHDALFQHQPDLSSSQLKSYAADLKLDATKFAACLDSGAKTGVVRADMQEGNQRGIDATPTFFVNGEKVDNWQNLKSIIQAKLVGG